MVITLKKSQFTTYLCFGIDEIGRNHLAAVANQELHSIIESAKCFPNCIIYDMGETSGMDFQRTIQYLMSNNVDLYAYFEQNYTAVYRKFELRELN